MSFSNKIHKFGRKRMFLGVSSQTLEPPSFTDALTDENIGACNGCGKCRSDGPHQISEGKVYISCLSVTGLILARVDLKPGASEECELKYLVREA